MEREYKWKASAQDFDSIMTYLGLSEGGPVAMLAQYYDTRDRLLRSRKIACACAQKAAKPSAASSCATHPTRGCMSMKNTNARARYAGGRPPAASGRGAPAELCKALRAAELDVVAETKFRRRRAIWKDPMFTAELSFDEGTLSCAGKSIPVGEVECEQKGGDETSFEEACQILARRFSLKPESRSKLSRALDLERTV